jgi:hypothetical protein
MVRKKRKHTGPMAYPRFDAARAWPAHATSAGMDRDGKPCRRSTISGRLRENTKPIMQTQALARHMLMALAITATT